MERIDGPLNVMGVMRTTGAMARSQRRLPCRKVAAFVIVGLMTLSMALPSFGAADRGNDDEIVVPSLLEPITDLPRNLKTWGQETFTRDKIPLLLGIGAMTAIQVATDYETWQVAKVPHDQNETIHQFSIQGVSMGDGYFQFGIVGAFAASGGLFGSKRALRTASQITEAILSTGVVVQVIKHVTGRESPFSSESRTGVWRVFPNQAEYMKDFQKFDAVPSGHLSTAMATFIVIQENYPEVKWIPYVGYPIIGWISYGLVATGIHWWSDFPIAVALGYSFGKLVTRDNHRSPGADSASSNTKSWKPVFMPAISSEGEPIVQAAWTF